MGTSPRAGEANRYFDPWVELDKAWVAAAAGELTRAVDVATRAADMARTSKQFTLEATALYDAIPSPLCIPSSASTQSQVGNLYSTTQGL